MPLPISLLVVEMESAKRKGMETRERASGSGGGDKKEIKKGVH
jgi:hypothetical protein